MKRKGVMSAKGIVVDFDLLRIKEQISSAPKTTTVSAREDFIDRKFSRRLKRQMNEVKQQVPTVNIEPLGELDEVVESDPQIEQLTTKDK